MHFVLEHLIEQAKSLGQGEREAMKDDLEAQVEKTAVISWERHIQTIIQALLLAVLLWGGNTLLTLTTKVEVLTNELSNLRTHQSDAIAQQGKRIDTLESVMNSKTDNRYRSQDANRDFALRDNRILVNKEHIGDLEDEVDRLKKVAVECQQRLRDIGNN